MRRFSATILQAAVDEFRHTTPGMTAPGTAGKQTAHRSRVEPRRMLWTEHPPGELDVHSASIVPNCGCRRPYLIDFLDKSISLFPLALATNNLGKIYGQFSKTALSAIKARPGRIIAPHRG